MGDSKTANILKVRDDRDYIKLFWQESDANFTFESQQKPDWCSDGFCTKSELRSRIEPWLTSLFQSEHLSLLVGSGLTTAIQYDACESADNGMGNGSAFTVFSDEIENAAKESAIRTGRKEANIEDRIRVANEVIKGLTVLRGNDDTLGISSNLDTLRAELEKGNGGFY